MSKVIERHRTELQEGIELVSYIDRYSASYKCKKHGKFEEQPRFIRRYVSQCPKCRAENHHNKLDISAYSTKLANVNPHYVAVGEYVNMRTAIKHKCTKHKISFLATPYTALSTRRHACKSCGADSKSSPRISEQAFIKALLEKDIPTTYISGYEGMHKKAKFLCTLHNLIWETDAQYALGNRGCPACKQEAVGYNMYKRVREFKLGKRIVKLQGYEHIVLTDLLKSFSPKELLVHGDKISGFQYDYKGKKRWTFPDIFIVPESTYVEVKSDYTLLRDFEANQLKQKAANENGISYEVHVANTSGLIYILPKNWHTKTLAQVTKKLNAKGF